MLTLGPSIKVYLARGTTDMRKSFDGLAGAVRELLAEDPLSGHLFVFCGRRRHMVKILYWDGSGVWLLCKRLETGTFAEAARRELSPRDLFLLLEGLEVVRERARYTPRAG